MSDELVVAVDGDDVTWDFFGGVVVRAMNTEFDAGIDVRDVTTWDHNPVKDFPWQRYGFKDWWAWLRRRDWLWGNAPAIDGALGGILRLRAEGHQPELVTAKPDWAEPQVWRWQSKWQAPFRRIIVTDIEEPKHVASDADVLVDDRVTSCVSWVQNDPSRFAICFERPWNVEDGFAAVQPRLFYARDWHDVLRTIKELEDA